MGEEAVATGLYYPNWLEDECELDDDGDAPSYMSSNTGGWMKSTLDECCDQYFSWRKDDCVGSAGGASTLPATAGLWYPVSKKT